MAYLILVLINTLTQVAILQYRQC